MDFRHLDPKTLVEENLFDLLSINDLRADDKEEIFERILDTVRHRVFARIDNSLTPEKKECFFRLLDTANDEEIRAFLKSEAIDVADLVLQEALLVKADIINHLSPFESEGAY